MFLPISCAISHIFWFPGQLLATVNTDTWFERRRKNSCFSYFQPPFPWARADSFMFFAHFMGYSAHFLVPKTISSYHNPRYLVWEASQKLVFSWFLPHFPWAIAHSFHVFAHFMGYSAHFPVPGTISSYRNHRYMVWEASQKLVFFMFSAFISVG
jgi:hypothetical protein